MLKIVHLELAEANALVDELHRHHKPVRGHRFSVGAVDTKSGKLVGAAIVGRPVARAVNYKTTLEVTRLVTDGTKNACSFLYAAAARAGKELGYNKIQTYILEEENGTTLRAAGWSFEENTRGGQWKHTDGKPRRTDQPTQKKQRWSKSLNACLPNNACTNDPASPRETCPTKLAPDQPLRCVCAKVDGNRIATAADCEIHNQAGS